MQINQINPCIHPVNYVLVMIIATSCYIHVVLLFSSLANKHL